MNKKLIYILSLDIGGANTKYSLLYFDFNEYKNNDSISVNALGRYKNLLKYSKKLLYDIEYFPFWLRDRENFQEILETIKSKTLEKIKSHSNEENIDLNVVITTTAELSDAFYTKREGIEYICNNLESVFLKNEIKFITVNGEFISINESKNKYMDISASNWIATSLVFGEREKLGILLDMGSTTLDIIPIKNGIPVTIGKTDVERLLNSELFYSGILRQPIATIIQNVPFRNTMCPISFERFALVADVYLILGLISEEQYTCDTSDDRGKTIEESYARLSRIVCGDPEVISKKEILEMAKYIHESHEKLIMEKIRRAIDYFTRRFITPTSKIRFNITGLGANVILKQALEKIGIEPNQIFFRGLSEKEHTISTAICLGIVYLKKLLIDNKILPG